MKAAVIDTMAHVAEFKKKTPEKWQSVWKYVYSGEAVMYLTEPQVSEIYYQLFTLGGKAAAQTYLLVLKGRKSVRVVPASDGDKMALEAGGLKFKHRKSDISLVDSYILASALEKGATIYTADHGICEAAQKENCEVSFIPGDILKSYISA